MTSAQIDKTDPACWVYRPHYHKTSHHGMDRQIMLGPRAQEVLAPWLLRAGPDGRLFPINRNSLRQAIRRGCAQARVPAWNPNQLRHTVATEVRAKFGLEAAQVILGHSRANVTQTYAVRDQKQAAEIARKIG
jgi:integrase